MDNITESARFFLASNSAASELDHYSYPSYNSQTYFSTQAPLPWDLPPLVHERFDMSSLEQYMVSDAFVSKLTNKLGLNKTTAHSSNFGSQHTTSRPQQPCPEGCVCCLDPSHYYQSCPIIADYISWDLCKRDNMKHVVLMNGTLVITHLAPGKCIKECIDNWLKSCAPPTMSTNIVEAVSTTLLSLTSDNLSQKVCTSEVSPADLEELCLLDIVAVSTLKQADTIRKQISEASKAKSTSYPATWAAVKGEKTSLNPIVTSPVSVPQQLSPSSQPPTVPTTNHLSTTHTQWCSNIEEPEVIQYVIDKTLESPVMLTQWELYAISPDIHQYLKDNVTTRRINTPNIASTNTLEEIEEDLPAVALLQGASSSPDLLIVQPTVELCTILVKLEENVEVEAILYNGSQVVSIYRDVWEKLKSPIHTNQAMTMESANGSCWWGSKGLIMKQRWKQGQRGKISKLLHNCALNK